MKQILCDLQDLYRAEVRKHPASVSAAVDLAVEKMNDVVVTSSPGMGKIFDPRIDKLTELLASTGTEGASFTAKYSDLKNAREKAKRELQMFVRNLRTETKTSEDLFTAE